MTTHAVALKLPEFWEQHAAIWFAQAEAQFAIRRITEDETKFYYVVASLTSSTASRVLSFLQAPPEGDKVQQEQIAAIFKLLKDNQDTFGEVTEADVEEQLKLYTY